MSVKLVKKTIKNKYFSFNCILFIPSESVKTRSEWALFTHGYTASKSDCLNWAQRLSETGIPCAIFDLPGHYLGSFNEVNSFQEFIDHSHECFIDAFDYLKETIELQCDHLILGGHSLGGMLSIKALELDAFKDIKKQAIAIGVGISQHTTAHLFETSFYEKTLNVRNQLVCEHLNSKDVFPWIQSEKLNVSVSGHKIHIITGVDDVVVGEGGTEAFQKALEANGNIATIALPRRLAHHEPSTAASHIFRYLKPELGL